jgi:ABC-type multidrug transport system ATPase subunit
MTKESFMKRCYYMPQFDSHWAYLSPREILAYAAELSPDATHTAAERVLSVLKTTGLESCADTRVGNQFTAGLSGGQKRRLSLALALLAKPLVLFMDEPTSGLDSAAAASIMLFIRGLAKEANIIVVCTIHQPSASVYAGFDQTMVLSAGRGEIGCS